MRRVVSYANIMSTIAAFLALGGSAYALSVSGRHVVDRSLTGRDIAKRSISANHLQPQLRAALADDRFTLRDGQSFTTTEESAGATASCQSDEVALAGGYNLGRSDAGTNPTVSSLIPAVNTFTYVIRNGAPGSTIRGATFVLCMQD